MVEGNTVVFTMCDSKPRLHKTQRKASSVGIGVVNAFPVNKIRETHLVFDR